MICSTCGEPAPVDARFCPHCGSSMAAACANCGTPLVAGARFCATCGTAAPGTLVGATPPTTPTIPRAPVTVSERRLVTVLFADLVGFTTLAESRDAEAVRDLLSRYFEQCQDVIGRYGGAGGKVLRHAGVAGRGGPVAPDHRR